MNYAANVSTTNDLGTLVSEMAEFNRKAQSGRKLLAPLSTSIQMWEKAGTAIGEYAGHFAIANQALERFYTSSDDSTEYYKAVRNTQVALDKSHNSITAGTAGTGIPDMLESARSTIQFTADTVQILQDYVTEQVGLMKQANAPQAVDGGTEVNGMVYVPTADEQKTNIQNTINLIRPKVIQAGATLDYLADYLQSSGTSIVSASSQMKWVGPGAGAGAGAPPGGVPGGAPGGVPGGAPTDAGGPAGQEAGGAPTDAGAGGETPGAGGEMPGGDTGLAGMPTAPPPVMPPPVKMPTVPSPHLPGMPPPVAMPPVAPLPVRPGTGARGIGRIGGGGPGGIGGGIGGGPGKGGGGLKTGNGFQQIPRAAQQVSAAPAPSGGQAPTAPTGLSSGAGAGAGSSGGGMPPMMPPMGGAGAGDGRNGKGAPIRPVGRKRDRRDEETPGVPVGLRGRAGKDLPGAFPAVPANTRRRQDSGPAAETLQLLDEELWQVDEAEVAAPQATPRLAN
ncbi:hypothetical protein ACIA49_39725 [Kribbella sp. NPDC051587]|uniref:hypothetical protein n=1 Tax=Kribbella sp. NPDC051587 TaxID=3364119 RepID=UPI0037B4366C